MGSREVECDRACLAAKVDPRLGLTLLKGALRRRPNDPTLLRGKARIEYAAHALPECQETLRQLLALNDDPQAMALLEKVLRRLGNSEAASEWSMSRVPWNFGGDPR